MDLVHSVLEAITNAISVWADNANQSPDMPLIFVGGFLKGLFRGIQKGLKKLNLGSVLSFAVPLIATGGLGAIGKMGLGALAKTAVKNALPNIAMTALAKGRKFGLQDVLKGLEGGAKDAFFGHIDKATAGRFGRMMELTQGLQSGNPLTMLASLQGMGEMMKGGQPQMMGGQPQGGFMPSLNPEMQQRTSATAEMLYADPEVQAQFAKNRVADYPLVEPPDTSGLPIQQRTSATGEMLFAEPEEQMRFAQQRQQRKGKGKGSQPDLSGILGGWR